MKKFFFYSFSFLSLIAHSQEDSNIEYSKTNPILYADMLLGVGTGVTGGGSLTYQHQKEVFTFRYNEHTSFEKSVTRLGSAVAFPSFKTTSVNQEFALMYGRRLINYGHSLRLSVGVSYNRFENYQVRSDQRGRITDNVGMPFEFAIRWFKKEKRKHRIYMILPVGKPTSFSRSIGFKFYGNISNGGFVGVGVVYGFGWHKKY